MPALSHFSIKLLDPTHVIVPDMNGFLFL